MSRKEGRWLISVIMSIVMTVSMLASPLTAMALDGEGEGGHNYAYKYINSDGQEIGVDITDDGYVYNQVNSDGQEVVKIYAYLGKEKTLNVPEKINNVEVASFAIDPRWPIEEESYDGIETINLPNTLQTAHAKFMNYYRGLKVINIAEGNPVYKSIKGVLYIVNGDGYRVAAYPRAKADKEFVMPDDMNVFYEFFEDCPIESLKINKNIDYVGSYRFKRMQNLNSLTVDPANKNLYSKNNALISREDDSYWEDEQYIEDKYDALIYFPVANESEEYTVPEEVTEIWGNVFTGVKSMKKLILSKNIRYIAGNALCDEHWLYADEDDKENLEKPSIKTVVFTGKTAPERYGWFNGVKNLYRILGDELNIEYPEDGTGYKEFIDWIKDTDEEEDDDKEINSWDEEPYMDLYEYPIGAHITVEGRADCGYRTEYAVFSNKIDGEYTKTVPSTVGTWYAKLIVDETEYYTGLESDPIEFKIVQPDPEKKYDNYWISVPYDVYAEYGDDYIVEGTALFGEPRVLYGDKYADPDKDEEWTDVKPTKPGTYSYKLIVDETPAYEGLIYISSEDWCWIDIDKKDADLYVSCDDVVLGNKPNPSVSFYEGSEYDFIDLSKVEFKYYLYDEDDDDIPIEGVPTEEGYYRVRAVYNSDFYNVYGYDLFYIKTKAGLVEMKIDDLPSPKYVDLEDKEIIQEAADAFAALTAQEKKEVNEEYVQKLEKVQNRFAALDAKTDLKGKTAAYDSAAAALEDGKAKAADSKKAAEDAAATPSEAAVNAAAKAEADAEIVKTASAALKEAAEALAEAVKKYGAAAQNDPTITKRDRIEARKAAEEIGKVVEEAAEEIKSADKAYKDAEKAYEDIDANTHTLVKHDEVKPTCTSEGTQAYWECKRHKNELFSDEAGKNKIDKPAPIAMLPHTLVNTPAKAATPTKEGNKEYWTCQECGKFFSDADGKNEIVKDSWITPKCEKYKNTMKVSAKKVSVKSKKVAKKDQTVKKTKAFTVKKAKGKVSFKLFKKDKKAKNKITINKKGNITVKKGLAKGKYTITVKVTAAGNASYKKLTKKVKVKVVVA